MCQSWSGKRRSEKIVSIIYCVKIWHLPKWLGIPFRDQSHFSESDLWAVACITICKWIFYLKIFKNFLPGKGPLNIVYMFILVMILGTITNLYKTCVPNNSSQYLKIQEVMYYWMPGSHHNSMLSLQHHKHWHLFQYFGWQN